MEFECSSYVAYFRVLSDGLTICPGCFPAFSPKFWVGSSISVTLHRTNSLENRRMELGMTI